MFNSNNIRITFHSVRNKLCPFKCKQFIVHILHHHVGLLEPIPALHWPAIPLELTVTVLVEPAQGPGECGLSGPVVVHHADDFSPSGGKADSVKDGTPLIAQGDIVQRQHRSPDRSMDQ